MALSKTDRELRESYANVLPRNDREAMKSVARWIALGIDAGDIEHLCGVPEHILTDAERRRVIKAAQTIAARLRNMGGKN